MSVYRSLVKIALICLSSTALVACGDGSNAGVFGLASVFSSGSATVDFSENSTEVIYTADASASSSQSLGLAYTLSGGDDLDKFELGAKSGNLWFIEPQDFENPGDANQDNAYEVEISAYEIAVGDDLNEDNIWSVTLTVRLSDANEAPTFDSPAVVSADENSAGVIYVAAASDVDAGDSYSFSLVSGDDRSWFSLDGSDLSFTSPPDYEIAADSNGDNAYELVIRVTDSSGLSADLNLTVYVTDVNDAPTITNAASNLIVPENTSGIIYEIVATDAENDTLEYEISSVDSAAFSISGSAVSFNSIPDYEFPTDSGFDNAYNINIEVSDGSNITTQALTVAVNDLNDNIPIIVPSQNFIIQENSSIGTVLGAVEVNDGDATATTYQDWKIKGGNTNGAFAIDPSSGELSVANSSALDYESGTTSYALTLTVSDGVNTSSSEIVNVNVYDVNEAPVIDSDQTFAVAENKPDGGTIGVVQAEDVDAGAALQDWQIVAGNTNGAFALNASTGVLSVAKSSELDYESGTTSYFLAITVSDGVNTSGLKTLTVNINDVNDNTPAIDSAQSFDVYENSADNTLVGNVVFSDADSDEVNTFTWSITDGNTDGAFAINANGEITVATSSQLDHETTTSYTLSLQVSDGDNISAEESLRIDIKDLNDNQPKIEAGVSFRIDEDSADNTYVGTVNATDADSASVNSFTWSITSENTSDIFAIETGSVAASSGYASSGEIRVINSSVFDYETQPSYELTITVSDGSNTSFVQTVQVNLDDVNEAPFFTSAPTATTSENDESFIYTAIADDFDSGDSASLSYSLIGGADQSLFNLNGAVLSFIAPPDYETLPNSGDNTYEVELQVTDTGGLSDELNLSISVVDTNDNAPVITAKQTFTIDENSENGISLGTVALDDPDTDAVNTFTWTITSSNTNNAFSIDSDDGELRVATSSELDHESTPSYTIKLTVNDGQQNSAEADITIKVDDVNESPVINSDSVTEVSVAENINHETYIIYQATATDSDDTPLATDPEGDTLTYSLAGEDADLFTIGTSDGIVKFQAAPDYDAPTDADKNNEYKISIQVSDSIHTAEHAMDINLTGVDEPPVINNTNTTVNVAENIGTVLIEYDINATDPEGVSLTYALSGVDASDFNISSDGYISFKTSPNYEAPHDNNAGNDYQVTFQVSDGTTATATQAVTIKVNNVNEAPTANAGADQRVNEGMQVTLNASASDPDEGDELTYNWQEVDSVGNAAYSPLVSLESSDTATTAFTSPTNILTDTAITFQLTVTDAAGNGNSATDSVVITVNHSPIADAGVNQNVDEGEQVTLTGSASDTDGGEIKSYSWVEVQADDQGNLFSVSPGTVTLTNPTATDENKEVTTSFTAPEVVADSDNKGVITLTFQLTVTDNDGAKDQSVVTVEVENLPVIDKVYLQDDDSAYGIGDTATVYIQAGKSETSLKLQAFSNFNGGTLTGFTEIGQGLYSAKYSVLNSHYSVAAGGTVTTSIVLTDGYGHVSAGTTSVDLTEGQYIDTEPPDQTISTIDISHDTGTSNADFITNIAAQTITAELNAALEDGDILYGSVASDDDGNSVWLDINGSISAQDGTSINWSTTLSSDAGSLIQFKVVDAAGNDGQVATQAYTWDIEIPSQVVTLSSIKLSTDTGTADDDFITNTAEQSISAELNASLSSGDVLYASVDDGANWAKIYTETNLSKQTSFSWTTTLPAEGNSSIQFQIADSADNNGSLTEQNYTLDITAPSQAVTLSSIKLSNDTGTADDDFITNTAEQSISAELNASLSSGDVLYASVDDGANWAKIYTETNLSKQTSFSWTTTLPAEGNSSIQFQIADSADNNGSLTEQNYTLDITAPSQAVTLSSIKLSNDTGTADDDFITNIDEQSISAELNASLSSGDVLYASVDDGANWAKIYTETNLSKQTSFSWTTSLPAEGSSSIQFQVADSADNNGSLTEQSYTLDQTEPSQAVTLSSIKLSNDTGTADDDFITNIDEQSISAELNASLSSGDVLYASVDDGASWAMIYTDKNLSDSTSFSWTTTLPAEGTSSIQFQVADSADNNGSITEQNYTLDTIAPSLAVTLSSIKLSADTGSSNTDFITNTAEQIISAELNATLGIGDVLYASIDDGASWAKIYTDENLSDSTSFSWTTSLPTEGNSSIQFQVADSADNNGSLTEQNYTLDTIAPSLAVQLDSLSFATDTGTADDDFITNTAEQSISAELDVTLGIGDVLYASIDDGVSWAKIYTDANLSGNTKFSWTTSLPAEGNSSIQFQVADSADNNGSLTEQNYTLDTIAPSLAVKLDSLSFATDTGTADDDFITNTAEQSISAELNASLSSGDVLYASVDDGANWAKIYTDENLSSISFSWTTSLLEGNSSIQFQVADSADNNGSLTEQNYTLDQTAPSLAVKLDSLSFDTDTGTADDDFITNTAEQSISAELDVTLGIGDVLYASIDDGVSWAKIYTDGNLSGNTKFSWTTTLPAEGNSSIQFQVADSADNNGSLTEQNYTLDTIAPSLAVKLDSLSFATDTGTADDDFITNTAEQSISAELDVTLGIGDVLYASIDDGVSWAKIYTDGNLSGNTKLSWTTSLPAEGNSSIQFQVADSADNNGSLTEQNYTLDTIAPSLAVKLDSLSFATDTGTADDDFITNTAEQSISAELNASLSSGDVLYASVDDGANWAKIYTDANLSDSTSFSWTTTLPAEGTSSIQFQVADSADNNGSLTEQNYTLDQTAPSQAVTISSIKLSTDTGGSNTDFITNTAEQTISAELNASLSSGYVLYASVDDGANWAKIYTDANLSATSFSWSATLLEGFSSIQFQVADSADNNGSLTEQNYTFDQTAPSLAVKLDSLSFATDTGTADDDFITNTAEQSISAELNATLGIGDVLYASIDDGASWAKIYTDANLSDNTKFSWTTSLPAEGSSSIQFQVADSADNNGSLTEQSYTLDQTEPSQAVTLSSIKLSADTGTADDDFITNTDEQSISGELDVTLGIGDVLYASIDDGASWAKIYTDANLSSNTKFSWTTSLPAEGNSSIQFQVADSADNNGSLTEQNYTLDTIAPSLAVKLDSLSFATDTGTADDDFITNTAEQSISAELNASLSSGDVLYASVDDGANWAKIYTDANLSGNTKLSWTTSLPAEGNSSIQFQVADSADNNGSLTEQNYTLDTIAPSLAVKLDSLSFATDTGTADDDFITNTAEQSISAELNASLSSGDVLYASVDDGANWAKIYTDANLSDNTKFSWTTSLPAEGSSSIQFQVADSADNNGSLTEQSYTLDQTEPSQAVTLSSIKLSADTGTADDDFITNTDEQSISGELDVTLGIGDVLYASVDDGASWAKIYTDANLSSNTKFSWTTSLPAEGNSSIQFQVADSADNNGSLTEQNYTLDTIAPSLAVKLDSLSFATDTGTADDDFITNTAEQSISAELDVTLGIGDVLYASIDDGVSWAKIYTDENLSSISFLWTTSLLEGNSSIQFQVADSADNNGSLTEQNYTLDTIAPSLAVKLDSLSFATDTGTADDDFITNTAEQSISAELNASLSSGDVLYASVDDGANWAKIYTDENLSGNTKFSWTTSLPAEGNSSIQFQVADSADNNGSLTEQNYTIDQTAPSLAVTLSSIKLSDDTGSSNTDFITNTAEQSISAELNATLGSGDVLYASIDDGASWAKIYTDANLSDSTSFSWTTSLPAEGNSSIQFQVADSADNNGSLTEQNYTLDTIAPSLAVTISSIKLSADTGSSNTDFITNTAEQSISAELNASLSSGDVLYASVDDGASWAKIYTDANLSDSTSFSWTTSLPAEGNSSIQFQVADSADNNGSLTEQNYTLDQTAPSQAVTISSIKLSADTGTADDDFITNTAEQSISAELNASLGSGDVLYASVDDGANWAKIYTDENLSSISFSWTTSLLEGNSSIQFQVADSADNNGSLTEQNYTFDQTAPSLAVKLDSLSFDTDTGTADDDFITNIDEQSISAELNASLGSGDVLYASVDDGANWAKIYTETNLSKQTSFSWTTTLPAEGNSSIQFQIADSADNNGSLTEQNYTLDTIAPSLAVKLDSLSFATDTGTADDDFITNTAEQSISAELDVTLGIGDVLYASIDDGVSWAKIYTDGNLSGNTKLSWTTSLPAEGNSSIQFQVADSADNNGSLTEQNYTLDTIAPSLAVKLDSLSFATDTGTADDDFITNTAEQSISAELNASLSSGDVLYASVDDGANWAKIYTDANLSDSTSFSWTTTLPAEGTSSIQFQVADSADNNGSLTEQNYTLDQTAPSQAVTISSIKLSTDTGGSNTDFITNTAEQSISAELNASLGSGDVLYASVDDGANWAKIYTDENLSSISFSWTTSLLEGNSSIQFQVADSADNNGSLTEQNYTFDQTAPSLAVKLDSLSFDTDTGTADDDFITNTAEQSISAELNASLGSGDVLYASVDDGANWAKIYTDENLSSISFSWTTSLLEGNSSIQFQVADSADNNGSLTEQNYTFDQTAPSLAVKLDSLSFDTDTGTADDDFITNTAEQSISAELNASLGSGDVLYASVDDGANWAKIYTDENLSSISFSWTTSLLEGNSSIQFQVADSADNNGSLTEQNYTFDQTAPSLAVKLDSLSFDTDTGTADDDFITNTAEQSISAELNASLGSGDVLYASVDDGANWAKIYTDENLSSISFSWTTSLLEGNSSIQFQVADSADNNGSLTEQNYTLDQTAPSLAVKLDSLSFATDTGTADDDFITNIDEQSISAELNASLGSGDVLYASVDDGANWAKIYTDENLSSISFSWTTSLLEGNSSIQFQVADSADNNGSLTEQNYTFDQTAPSLAVKLDSLSFDTDTGTADDDFITNTAEQSISAELNASLGSGDVLYASVDDGANWAKIYTDENLSSISFSWTTSLLEGNSSIQFQVADSADNNGSLTEQNYTFDQTAPSLAVKLDSLSFATDTGTADDDFITNTAEQSISAELNASLGSGDVLYASVDDGANWAKIYTDENLSSISFSWTTSLLEGNSSIQFQIADSADNNGSLTEQNYTLDQTAPLQAVTLSSIKLSADTGNKSNDFITNIESQTISATLSAALDTDGGDTLHGSLDSGSSWTDITGKISDSTNITWNGVTLEAGTHKLIFRITDIADNNTTVSLDYTLDQTPPDINTNGTASEVSEAFAAALDASSSSDDGSGIASYSWAQVASDGSTWSGDALVITSANSATTSARTPGIADDDGANLSFYFAVTIADIAGNDSTSSALTLTVTNTYTTPAITASAGTAPDFNQLSLSWAATSGLTYNLHRSTASSCDLSDTENCAHHLEYAALDLSSGDQITQIDSDLGLFSSYYYWLEAQLNGEVVSLSSAPLEANTTGPALNDTGVVQGADYPNGFDSLGDGVCNGGYIDSNDDDDDGDTNEFIAFANEDCELGRDATNNDDSDGHAGFSFTKLDTDGTPLAADAISWACVVDNTTGLIWEVKTDDGSWQDKDEGFTWHDPYNATFSGTASDQDTDDFIAYANSSLAVNNAQGLCGRTDWRLPTVHEIQGLTDYSAVVANGSGGYTTPAIDTTYFPHASTVPDQWYWTAQLNVNTAVNANTSTNNYYAWAYGSALGNTSSGTDSSTVGATSNTNLVRLVSSSTAVESHFSDYSNDRYTDNGDGTISDAKTGLMWMKCTYGQAYNSNNNSCNSNGAISGDWLAAFTNAAASNSANSGNGSFAFTDWRLPNVKELGSIVDFGNHSPAINQSIFPNTVSAAYWSSTPSQADNSQTIIIGFQAGDYGAAARNTTATTYLRLVRDDIKTPRILTLNINGDNIVNASDVSDLGTIPVSGTTGDVESGQQLSLVINGTTYSADIADDGSFTTTIDLSTLADGTYGVTADVSDINNKAANQFTSTLRKDIVLPSITEVIVAGDDIINIAEASAATISGTTDGVEDGQIVSVVISDSSDPAVEITATASVTSNAFNITNLNLSSLADSTSISLSANVADSAGNSAATFTNTLIKDTAAPTIAITSVATDNKINASEASTAAIIGTASEDDQSVALAITDGSTTVEATPTVADGLYSATVDLSSLAESTSISLSATILDTAGNDATATQESITKDTIAPSIASIFVADNNFVNSKELDNAVAVSGATSGVEDYQAITITINGEDISTDVIASTFTTDADLSDLNDGTYSLSANVADAAGNPAEKFTGSYVIETVPPTQAVKPDSISLSHDTSSSTSYFLTNQAAQTISAELNASLGSDEALYASVDSGSTWLIIYSEENLTDSTGSPTTSFSWDTTLQEGTYSIYFRVTDTADNNSTDTTQAYTLDLSAPQISSAATASIPENTSGTIYTALARDTETMSLGLSLSYALSGTDATQLSIDSESGEISFKSSPDHENPTDASTGAEGSVDAADTNNTYQITLEATDPAGNTATQELTITVTDLNDVAPVIDPEQSLGIIETSATGGTVGTVAAIDPDTANTFTWSITDADNGGSTTIDNPSTYFAINSSTGQITVTQALTENAAGADSYDVKLNLQVSDGVNTPYQGPVTITVQAAILPDDFGVAGIGAYLVKLTWSELEGASDLYYIYRSSDNACDLANYNSCADGLLSSSVTPPFTDIVPESGIAYYYWLHAERPNSTLTQTSATPISATPEPRLNDTGIYWNAANNGGNNSDCVSNTNIDAPQDCDYGLDANTTVADDADGHAGFSFTKLGSDGYPLSANASSWSCVQDNVTGLIWEVKTDGGNGDDIGGDLHDKDDTYNWYNTNSETNGGSDGYADDDGAICYGYGSANSTTFCNTEAFVARVNSAGLCGAHDWRLPHINEIRSISNYAFSNAASGARLPGIDTSYFPNTQMHVNNKVVSYWSASPSVSASEEAWTHNYYYDTMSDKKYTEALYIRLVRGGQ